MATADSTLSNLETIMDEAENRYHVLRSANSNNGFSYRVFKFSKGVVAVEIVSPVMHLLTAFTDDGVALGCRSVSITADVVAPVLHSDKLSKPKKLKSPVQ